MPCPSPLLLYNNNNICLPSDKERCHFAVDYTMYKCFRMMSWHHSRQEVQEDPKQHNYHCNRERRTTINFNFKYSNTWCRTSTRYLLITRSLAQYTVPRQPQTCCTHTEVPSAQGWNEKRCGWSGLRSNSVFLRRNNSRPKSTRQIWF